MASEVSDLWMVLTPGGQSLPGDFTVEELTSDLQHLKPGKAPGPHSTCPELVLHAGSEMKSWLCKFLYSCWRNRKISKIWRRALVVTIFKLNKSPGNRKCYRPISLLCIPFKILEHLIYAGVKFTINPNLSREQAGF